MKIREATTEDLDDILRLNLGLFENEYEKFDKSLDLNWTHSERGRKYFLDKIEKENSFLEVAEEDGRVVGYLSGEIYSNHPTKKIAKYAWLGDMFLEEEFREKGIGSELVNNFIDWAKKNNADYLSVLASARNEKGINFYQKFGLKEYEIILERKL